jgi:hypothetical protein
MFGFSAKNLSGTFIFLRRTERDVNINVLGSSDNITLISVGVISVILQLININYMRSTNYDQRA